MSDTTTRGIRVQVRSFYDEERSSPSENYYFFVYTVTISNVGEEPAQLVSREWLITDGNGDTQRVRGPGVVGEQPVLAPGESFEYTSFCPLSTSVGSMHGAYLMVLASGDRFEAEIAPFSLSVPHAVN
jgi:ApaG protein